MGFEGFEEGFVALWAGEEGVGVVVIGVLGEAVLSDLGCLGGEGVGFGGREGGLEEDFCHDDGVTVGVECYAVLSGLRCCERSSRSNSAVTTDNC